jgi:hypothetical protein
MQTGSSVDIAGLGVPPSTLTERRSLWIHGAAMTGATWDSLRADLPAAIAPDLPGRGNEPALPGPNVEGYAHSSSGILTRGVTSSGTPSGAWSHLNWRRDGPSGCRPLF